MGVMTRTRSEWSARLCVGAASGALVLACGTPDARSPDVASKSAGPTVRAVAPSAKTPDGAWPFGPPRAPDADATQVAQLRQDPGPVRTNWVPPGKSERYGHAEGLVAAPLSDVRARLVDFAHYKELCGPKFKTVRVVKKDGDATDLYFRLPIMRGIVTLWYVTRFAPARHVEGVGEVVEGRFVEGNVKDMHIALVARPADERTTVLSCDILLSIGIPAPQSAIDEELRDACGDAIRAVRERLAPSPTAGAVSPSAGG